MAKVHLLAGQNNAGKSNVLRFARDYLAPRGEQPIVRPSDLDVPNRSKGADSKVSVGIRISDAYLEHVCDEQLDRDRSYIDILKQILLLEALRKDDDDIAWFEFKMEERGLVFSQAQLEEAGQNWQKLTQGNRDHDLQRLVRFWQRNKTGMNMTTLDPNFNINRIWELVDPRSAIPSVKLIDAFRQVGAPIDGHDPHSGAGLIEQLAEWDCPGFC